jgi:hypothetical protein
VTTFSVEVDAMESAKRSAFRLLVLAGLALLHAAGAARADTTLRWKFTAGQKRSYVLTQKTVTKMEVMGKPIELNDTQTADFTWDVKSIDKDGNAEMTQTIHNFKLQVTTPETDIVFDTNKPQDVEPLFEPVWKLFKSMTGAPFTLKFTPRGEIRDIAVPAQLVEAIGNAAPTGDEFSGGEEVLKNMTVQSIVAFPEGAVVQGRTWPAVQKLLLRDFTVVIDTTYTLESATETIETIAFGGKVKIEPKPGSPFEMSVKSQSVKGQYCFDNAAGCLKASDLVLRLVVVMTGNGQDINQDLYITFKLEPKPDGDAK